MKSLTVTRSEEGDLDIRHIPPALAFALRELPGLLSEEFPESASRTVQDPYAGLDADEGDESSADWVRNGHPELRHLFESARDLVTEDLAGLEMEDLAEFEIEDIAGLEVEGLLPPLYRLRIPGPNLTAWLSALAAARVGLGEAHEVTSEDLERTAGSLLPNERDRSILLIQLLGWMQSILIEGPEG